MGHTLKIARIGSLLLAGAMLCLPGWAQSPKSSKKKATAPNNARSSKNGIVGGTKETPTNAKSSARGKSRRISSKSSNRREKGQKAPTSDRIAQIQQALGKDGAYANQPSGKWDASTVEAVKKFQTVHGLNPSGKLDAKTLQQLGLGSATAGVAPPAPLVSSVNRLTSSSSQAGRRQ